MSDNLSAIRTKVLGQLPQFIYLSEEYEISSDAHTVGELLDEAVATKGYASQVMLRSDRVDFTYAESLERVNRIANV
ncbi:MAG: hypothetical protein EAZ24_13615, partial [Burkholderiales bacterium]